MQPVVAVFVGSFVYPPTELFVEAIRQMLPVNFENCVAHVVTESPGPKPEFPDIRNCIGYTLEQTQRLLATRPGCLFSASVVPLQLEFQTGTGRLRHQHMILVGLRNTIGNEWLYAHFVGKIIAPVEVTHELANAVNSVLEERGTLDPNTPASEVVRVASLIDVIANGVVHVLRGGSEQISLDS